MKFRADFVTNSSSSCYIVSYEVQGIPFQPLPNDYMGELSISYAHVSIKDVIERIKNGASVDEITTMFAESTRNNNCLEYMFSEGSDYEIMHSELSYEEILERISNEEFEGADEDEAEDDASRAEDYLERIRRFRKAMSRLSSASEIKEIVVTETYSGWGEFLSDSIQNFVNSLDSDTLELAEELLGDGWSEWWDGIERAEKATHYNVTDGTSFTTIQGYADPREYILDMYWKRFRDVDAEEIEDEMPKLEFIADKIEAELSLPKIVDALLSKGAVDYAEQFLNSMTDLGGKHAEVAEGLKEKVKEEKTGLTKEDETINIERFDDHLSFHLPNSFRTERSVDNKGRDVYTIFCDAKKSTSKNQQAVSVKYLGNSKKMKEEKCNLRGNYHVGVDAKIKEIHLLQRLTEFFVITVFVEHNCFAYVLQRGLVGWSRDIDDDFVNRSAEYFNLILDSMEIDGDKGEMEPITAQWLLELADAVKSTTENQEE